MGQCASAPTAASHETDMLDLKSRSKVTKLAPSPRVLIIQNDVLCPPCSAIVSLIEHDIPYQVIYGFHENAFTSIEPLMYEAIIVLGGRSGVYDAHRLKWLQNQIMFIETALKEKVPVLGICLGAQILAHSAGGEVMVGDKGVEIGYQDWIFVEPEAKNTSADTELDPFIHALKCKDMDKFVILFHGDTFTLPSKCELNGQEVEVLANTTKYLTLFKIGKYSYGFQGHPELNHDLVKIWCQSWDEEFLKKADVDIEKDVVQYSLQNKDSIDKCSKVLFDIWIDVALIHCVPTLTAGDTMRFDEYTSTHWNVGHTQKDDEFPIALCGSSAAI
eukprot:207400_1